MENFHIQLHDIPRKYHAVPPLHGLVSYSNATGIWNGKRPGTVEFAIRIDSTDEESEDFQDGILLRNSFPHLFIKTPHSLFFTRPFAPRNAFVLIYDENAWTQLNEYGFSANPTAWPLDITSECSEIMAKMDFLCDDLLSPGNVERLDVLAVHLLTELYAQRPASPDPDSFYHEKIKKAASWFRRHYADHFELNHMLTEWGFSRRSFFRYWKEVFQQTPKQYLLNLRLQEAARKLGYETPISEIANSLYFNDLSHFSKQFRKQFGITPSEYRSRLEKRNQTVNEKCINDGHPHR